MALIDDKTVFTDSKDYTLSTIREMCAEGDIQTNPDYQRDYVYDNKRASKLVESLLMGIPIPTIYLCQENDETYSVIDGQQRITSFVRYLENEFELTGLLELPELNGKKYKDLEKPIQKRLKSSSLRAIIILKESQELKYEIFARLNQGAVSLKPQELRNCIYRGTFNNMLEELAKNKYLPTLFHTANNRKSYQELVLRFFALRNFMEYKSSINKTMNDYMAKHQHDCEREIGQSKAIFTTTVDIIKQILGNDAFLAVERDKNIISEKFSGSVYDSIIIPFSFFHPQDLIRHSDAIRKAILELKTNNAQYREDTYAATGSRKRVHGRIMSVYDLLMKITGKSGNDYISRNFSDEVKEKLFYNGYICSYCNNVILSIEDAEVDHIVPFSKGGKTELNNAQLLHRLCNRSKSDSIDINSQNFEDE